MSQNWTALIAAERMELDGEFADRISASSLTSQQWGLVMTAVEFEIETPETPEDAVLVANTENLPAVADDLDRLERAGPTGAPVERSEGLLSRILDVFGSDDGDDERLSEAEELAAEYASRLQEKLIERGRWESVCAQAASA